MELTAHTQIWTRFWDHYTVPVQGDRMDLGPIPTRDLATPGCLSYGGALVLRHRTGDGPWILDTGPYHALIRDPYSAFVLHPPIGPRHVVMEGGGWLCLSPGRYRIQCLGFRNPFQQLICIRFDGKVVRRWAREGFFYPRLLTADPAPPVSGVAQSKAPDQVFRMGEDGSDFLCLLPITVPFKFFFSRFESRIYSLLFHGPLGKKVPPEPEGGARALFRCDEHLSGIYRRILRRNRMKAGATIGKCRNRILERCLEKMEPNPAASRLL